MLALAQSGVLLAVVGIRGVLLINVLTFSAAVVTLWAVRMPDSPAKTKRVASVRLRLTYGFCYIGARPPLRTLAVLYVLINVVGAVGLVLLAPLTLARSGGSEVVLGSVMAALGAGGVTGGVLMSIWGGPKNRMLAVLAGLFMVSTFGYGLTGLATSPLMALAGAFCITFFLPLLGSSHQAIWQSAIPVVMLGAGPLADALSLDPALAPLGPGAGMVVLFLATALLGVLVVVVGSALPGVRGVEQALEMMDRP